MSEKITMELTVEEARQMIDAPECPSGLRDRIKNALPVEYADGTIAWVTSDLTGHKYLSVREDGRWVHGGDGKVTVGRFSISKVEPILTPGDVVVSRKVLNELFEAEDLATELGEYADTLADASFHYASRTLLHLAAQIEKQEG